jgi:hypothetical protein
MVDYTPSIRDSRSTSAACPCAAPDLYLSSFGLVQCFKLRVHLLQQFTGFCLARRANAFQAPLQLKLAFALASRVLTA